MPVREEGDRQPRKRKRNKGRRDMINTAALFSDFLQQDPRAQIACK